LPEAKTIRLDRIEADPTQPRRSFDPEKLAELVASIRREGVLQPIAVHYDAERDVYVVLHGERRWRASREAGLVTIPALVRDVPEEHRLLQQLMENVVREDLNAIDRATALRTLKAQLGDAPWEAVAEAVGIRRSRLFQLLGTEKLPDSARADIRAGRLSEKQSRALQGLPTPQQEALRSVIVADELGAEEAMRLSRALRETALPEETPFEATVAALTDIRAGSRPPLAAERVPRIEPRPATDDPLGTLLAALSTAAAGGKTAKVALARAADAVGAPPYDPSRLEGDVLALARTLSRTPTADLRPGGAAYPFLAALCGALDDLLRGGS